MKPGGRIHRWPAQWSSGRTVQAERLHVGDGPHCDCAVRRLMHVPSGRPDQVVQPWGPGHDDHPDERLRLVPPARSIAPIIRFRSAPVRDGIGERRANLEATLALLMMVLLFVAIAWADDVRRFSDRTVGALERSATAFDDVRLGLSMAYAELLWRAGAR